jgi:hypothetical protein
MFGLKVFLKKLLQSILSMGFGWSELKKLKKLN